MDSTKWFYATATADITLDGQFIEAGTPLYMRRDAVQRELWIILTRDGVVRVRMTTTAAKTAVAACRNADKSVKMAHQVSVDRLHSRHLQRARRCA